MRSIALLTATAALAACTTAPQQTASAEGEAHFQRLIAGKAAGPAVSCISRMRADNMTVIDDDRVAFRDGNRVYLNDFRGQGCSGAGSGFYTLVTRSSGAQLCSGDIAELVDARTGMLRSACILGDFTPYMRTGA
jgi:hypothetical protein